MKLFFMILGAKPEGRHIEQHDIYFGIGNTLKDFVPAIQAYWPEAKGKIHVDSWREVHRVGQYQVQVVARTAADEKPRLKLYFLNLGGYKPQDLEEYHYKELVVAENLEQAKSIAKKTVFFKHHTSAHIDDKYAVDIDDLYEIEELLSAEFLAAYRIQISELQDENMAEDQITNGYFPLTKIGA